MSADVERIRREHRPVLSRPVYDAPGVNNPEVCVRCNGSWPCEVTTIVEDYAALAERAERLLEALRSISILEHSPGHAGATLHGYFHATWPVGDNWSNEAKALYAALDALAPPRAAGEGE